MMKCVDLTKGVIKTSMTIADMHALEIVMATSLLGTNAPRRIVHQQTVQQIETNVVQTLNQSRIVVSFPLGEGGFVVWQEGDALPVVFVGCAKDPDSPGVLLVNEAQMAT